MRKFLSAMLAVTLLVAGCKKADFADNNPTGEGLVNFTLIAPVSSSSIVLNAATPNSTVTFSWNSAKPGLTTPPVYKVVMALKNGGDINSPLIQLDVPGSATSLTLTYKQLDDALKAKGIADGATTQLVWSVTATNGDVSLISQSLFTVTITRFKDGATPFLLLGPASSTSSVDISPTSTTDNVKFNWTRSKPATGGPAVTYRVYFAERKTDPNGVEIPVSWPSGALFSAAANNNGLDSLLTMTQKQFNDSLVKYGFTDIGTQVNLKWTVIATSGTWNQVSDYQNNFFVSRLIKYFYPQALNVAGSHQGWDPPTAPQLVAMTPVGGPYVEYSGFIDFGGSAPEFKIVKGDNWGAGDYGMASPTLMSNGGANFNLPSGGVYLLKVNTTTLAWSADKINTFGLIGSATPNGWGGPDHDMTYNSATKKWTVTLNLVPGEMKFRANDDWPINLGDDGAGMLKFDGGNLFVTVGGNYTVTLSISSAGNWRYSMTKN